MKVPINPQTNVPSGQVGYARAVDVGAGARALASVVSKYAEDAAQEAKKRELFEVQKLLVDETNALQLDFEAKTSAEPLGATDFTPRINSEYQLRHEDLANGLRERNFSEEAIQEFSTRLGTIRSQYVARAIDFQDKSAFAKVSTDISKMAIGLSQYATTNPGAVQSSLDELQVALQNSGLDEIEQLQAFEQNKQIILHGARQGFALQNPETIIGLFDPEDPLAPAGSSNIELTNLDAPRKAVADGFTAVGFRAPVIAGFLGNFDIEDGYTGKEGDGGNAGGIAQWTDERRDNFVAQYGKDPTKASVEEQVKFAVWEMQNPSEAGMTVDQRDAILNAKTAEEAAELIDKYYERSSGAHRSQRIEAAKKYVKVMAHADATVEQLETPGATVVTDENGLTGIPIIDLSTGPERMQMLAWAKSHKSESNSQERAGIEVTHQNAVNAYLTTGDYAGPKPSVEDYTRIFGPVVGPQKFAELSNAQETGKSIQQFKTLPVDQIETQVEALRPKDTASPTYTEELQAYNRAREAADGILKARADNPSGYLFSTFPNVAKQLQEADEPQERKVAYAAISEAYKKIGIAPDKRYLLTEQQAKELQDKYSGMSPAQKIRQLSEWSNELGELFDPFMRQMTINGHGAGADVVMHGLLRRHPNGFATMSQILAGQAILKDDPARRPNGGVVNTQFKDTLGSAISILNPAASRIYNEAAAAIYVANGGQTDGGTLTDPELYAKALRLAVGGFPDNEDSGIVDMTQGAVKDWTILPLRTTEQQFTNWVERLTPGTLERLSLERSPPLYRSGNPAPLEDIIDEGVFVAIAPNHYIIKMASDGNPLKTASGRNFVVRIVTGQPQNLPRGRPRINTPPLRGVGR